MEKRSAVEREEPVCVNDHYVGRACCLFVV